MRICSFLLLVLTVLAAPGDYYCSPYCGYQNVTLALLCSSPAANHCTNCDNKTFYKP